MSYKPKYAATQRKKVPNKPKQTNLPLKWLDDYTSKSKSFYILSDHDKAIILKKEGTTLAAYNRNAKANREVEKIERNKHKQRKLDAIRAENKDNALEYLRRIQ